MSESSLTLMNYSALTTQSLIDLHTAVVEALAADDRTLPMDKIYGVRQYRGWRRHADALEAQMREKNIPFTPIQWN
jgi:hypothetical protein